MSDQKQLFLFGQALPGSDATLLEKIQDCANYRNRHGAIPTNALEGIPAKNILQLVVGHNHVAFLFEDFRIARLSFDIIQNKVESPSTIEKPSTALGNTPITSTSTVAAPEGILNDGSGGPSVPAPSGSTSTASQANNNNSGQTSYAAATAAAANRTAKIRRVMMAARRPGGFCGRAGVIVDRARPLVPASSIPEELIAQAQVVLQGKSRDVIVRELQRTNLNVNEAVNNLLSRDDDEGDDLDETSEAYLHEELLSLLDAGLRTDSTGSAAIIDHDNIYASAEGYEYLVSRDLARRREEAKFKDRGKDNSENSVTLQDYIVFDDNLQYWLDVEGKEFPPGVKRFLKIGAMHSELIALADDGKIYSWGWNKKLKPSNVPHAVNVQFFGKDTASVEEHEKIIDVETCAWKAVILTSLMRIGSFMDIGCGEKISEIFFEPLTDMPDGEAVEKLHVSPMFSVVKTTNDRLYWRGIFPYNERRKIFEKARTKLRKHVTFEVNEIVEGSEVRTKSAPIYSAGCVGINFSGGAPMVGTLMESAWTLNETCRFRIQTPEQYDQCSEDLSNKQQADRKVSFNLSVRKRAAPSDEGSSIASAAVGGASSAVSGGTGGSSTIPTASSTIKEAAWSLKDVIFAKEEIVNDVAVVKIVDGAYCGIVFKSAMEKQKEAEGNDSDISKLGLRLMRKDDLIVVPSTGKTLRAPDNFQRQLVHVQLPSNVRRIISMTVDSTGFRVLVEKKNRVHLIRMSCLGKMFSDHIMPICLNTLCRSVKGGRGKPSLENYGDDGVLLLRDATGNMVPLLRNASGGFREPPYIGMGRTHDLAIGLRYLKSADEINSSSLSSCEQLCAPTTKNSVNKNANRIVILATLIAPSPESATPSIPSLMQAILYCNVDLVRAILEKMVELGSSEEEKIRAEIVDARVDGNRNILHVAAMNAFSTTNKDQADLKQEEPLIKIDTSEADSARANFDRKWQEMVSNATPNTPTKQSTEKSPDDKKMDATFRFGGPLTNKERQMNAIEVTRELASHPVIRPYFLELMRERDANGHTPFNCAVQMRAYSAASILWNAIGTFQTVDSTKSVENSQAIVELIGGTKPDDSPLFVLCYNDTCSFTWTGDEHVNQDIFECKTCGLTGTFCCCTECAYTCHRNHDCRLKRTSPTAYCDCWEKCSCKALVSGNVVRREYLLTQLLRHTNLIRNLNARGEHLLLFLARTVGRQLVEQENFVRQVNKMRTTAHQSQQPAETTVPEHDLDPPKFSRRAFDLVLGSWPAVKSLFEVGLKNVSEEAIVVEDIFYLGEQNGSTHLDKFVFTLLARCQESHLDVILNTLIRQANLKGDERDPKIDKFISRFVRSVIRLFSLIIVISPSTAGLVLASISCTMSDPATASQLSTAANVSSTAPAVGGTKTTILSNYRAVAISGMLSLVRASLPSSLSSSSGKESKKKSLNAFVLKSRRIFQALVSYSITELLNASDALIAPVRLGMVKPSVFASASDVLDVVERYLYSEQDLSTLLMNSEDSLSALNKGHRNRGSSSHADETTNTPNDSNVMHSQGGGDSDSDSESDNDDQPSHRLSSQGSVSGAAEDTSATTSAPGTVARRAVTRKTGMSNRERRVAAANKRRSELYAGDSTDSLSSPSDDDESDDDDEDEDDDEESSEYDASKDLFNVVTNRIGHLNDGEGNNEDDEEDDEDREIDDEEEDAYFNMDDEEEEVESGADGEGDADVENDGINNDEAVNAGDSNDTAPAGQDEVSVELMDTNEASEDASNNASDTQTAREYSPPVSGGEGEPAGDTGSVLISRSSGADLSASSTSAARLRGTTPALNWAVNRVRQESENGAARENAESQQADVARGENRANVEVEGSTTAATAGSQATSTTSAPSRLRYRGVEGASADELSNAVGHTGMQLSMCFSVLVKLIDELILEVIHYKDWSKNGQKGLEVLLELDERLLFVFRKLMTDRLEPTWFWLHIIMDRTEAKLKFGNSLASSSVGSFISANIDPEKAKALDSSSKKDEKRFKKLCRSDGKKATPKDADLLSPTSGDHRSELCTYFLSLLRSHSSENGDDLPVIEFNSLKAIAFVVEAYLFHINLTDELETEILPRIQGGEEKMDVESATESAKNMRRFYQRSKSICYPYISTADSHHAFKYSANDCLPLSTRSHLLQPDAERNVLFALPVPHRTRTTHKQIAEEHGVFHPTHQSLSDPPVQFSDVIRQIDGRKNDDIGDEMKETSTSKRPNIIVHSSDVLKDKKYQENFDIDALLGDKISVSRLALQRCLGRWSNTTLFLSKAFHEQIIASCGGDASLSILLSETAGYHIRQSQFRQRMEKFKAAQTKDIVFSQVSRDKNSLLSTTLRQLNQNYTRRAASSTPSANLNNADGASNPILASHKVKVTFRDEPGEGTGVARSFYSAVADAILTMQHLPSDITPVNEDGSALAEDFGSGGGSDLWGSSSSTRRPPPSTSPTRNFFSRLSKRATRQVSEGNNQASGNADPNVPDYRIRTRSQRSSTSIIQPAKSASSSAAATTPASSMTRRSSHKAKNSEDASKASEDSKKVSETIGEKASEPPTKKDIEMQPLFYKTSKSGYYTPIPGSNSPTRLNAFRNVGRMIGLCLQQMEILPLFLCRHVFKFILHRPITWFDLAFYDPAMFDSLRSIVFNDSDDSSHAHEFYESLQLTFAVDISAEEGGGFLELKPGGENIPVTKDNVLEYIYLFVEHRLLGNHVKCLEAIRRGVFDVIPSDSLDQLTSEDLRLILCGNQDISVPLLESYTSFSDESSAAPDILVKYKQWFWSVLSKFNSVEKQDLVFFWTGSPSLPSTEEGFQPLPSIMIRPADDHHLPTANTCISRLYVPLYSTKKILRSKLLLAIKARNFGFV